MIRTRIAPSPSGFLHIGTAKTALYNWLFAKKHGGRFILRLEDTDAERTDEQYVQGMCEGFKWLGIEWDEGPPFGDIPEKGEYGPYRQSQRKHIYRKEAYRLLEEGKAYKCYCSKQELEQYKDDTGNLYYPGFCRNLTPERIREKGDAPYVIRFKVPEGETIVEDLIQGTVRFNNNQYDDFIILRANGDPVFHLAVVVDDIYMKISHVIRGDDHLTNAPRHIMLFRALGADLPKFAHHPLVHDEQGRKFSKRMHGANVLDWRDDGYLPEAIINYVALLGWTSEEENKEFFTLQELLEKFTLERISKSASRFDRRKLEWLNGLHIRNLPVDDLRDRLIPILEKHGFNTSTKSKDWLTKLAKICQEKLPTLNRIVFLSDFFFKDFETYEPEGEKKWWSQPEIVISQFNLILEKIKNIESWDCDNIKKAFEEICSQQNIKIGALVNPTRLAITGKTIGPGFFELTELLGKEKTIERLIKAIAYLKNKGA
ncbi:MAG: glutamate--tRNA ligase [Candidatus Hydrogenedentes bacterium]|nr:glutamate--tRNA ligase [Candidatus Hydrogenedentota bacterium]